MAKFPESAIVRPWYEYLVRPGKERSVFLGRASQHLATYLLLLIRPCCVDEEKKAVGAEYEQGIGPDIKKVAIPLESALTKQPEVGGHRSADLERVGR